MLAMQYRGPYRIRVVDKPVPEIEHPKDAIVRVTRACICGSDLHLYHGLIPDTRVGSTFGHEFVGIIEGTQQRALAEAWVDFMLDLPFQNDIPLQMFVYPANENATLPELFTQYGQIPTAPAVIDPADVEANREAWIEAWTNTMLR